MTQWERDIARAFRQAEQRTAVMQHRTVPDEKIDAWIAAAERDAAATIEAARAEYRVRRDHARETLSRARAEYEALRATPREPAPQSVTVIENGRMMFFHPDIAP